MSVSCDYVMSHVNASCHMWMHHVTCEYVMSHVNTSCHMWIHHVTCIIDFRYHNTAEEKLYKSPLLPAIAVWYIVFIYTFWYQSYSHFNALCDMYMRHELNKAEIHHRGIDRVISHMNIKWVTNSVSHVNESQTEWGGASWSRDRLRDHHRQSIWCVCHKWMSHVIESRTEWGRTPSSKDDRVIIIATLPVMLHIDESRTQWVLWMSRRINDSYECMNESKTQWVI